MIEQIHFDKQFHNLQIDTAENHEYEKCDFKSCDFSSANLRLAKFIDCSFDQCNLSNADINKSSFQDCLFTDCKMLGLKFESINTFNFSASFRQCQLMHSSFYQLHLKQCSFISCDLQEVDFTEADLSGIQMICCHLGGSTFDRTNLSNTDLRDSHSFIISPSLNSIKGAHFSKEYIDGLLAEFQIEIS